MSSPDACFRYGAARSAAAVSSPAVSIVVLNWLHGPLRCRSDRIGAGADRAGLRSDRRRQRLDRRFGRRSSRYTDRVGWCASRSTSARARATTSASRRRGKWRVDRLAGCRRPARSGRDRHLPGRGRRHRLGSSTPAPDRRRAEPAAPCSHSVTTATWCRSSAGFGHYAGPPGQRQSLPAACGRALFPGQPKGLAHLQRHHVVPDRAPFHGRVVPCRASAGSYRLHRKPADRDAPGYRGNYSGSDRPGGAAGGRQPRRTLELLRERFRASASTPGADAAHACAPPHPSWRWARESHPFPEDSAESLWRLMRDALSTVPAMARRSARRCWPGRLARFSCPRRWLAR